MGLLTACTAGILVPAGTANANQQVVQTPLHGATIPKYVDRLPQPPRIRANQVRTRWFETPWKVLPASMYPANVAGTLVWLYESNGAASYPGPTLEQRRNVPTTVTYVNELTGPFNYVRMPEPPEFPGEPQPEGAPILEKFLTVDQTMDWADPNHLRCAFRPVDCGARPTDPCCKPYGYPDWPGMPVPFQQLPREGQPVPGVVHLHGGEDQSFFDGHPEAWFTPEGERGVAYASLFPVPLNQAAYFYPNGQPPMTLWYHDHTFGMTRLNILAGLAGFYLLRDNRDTGLRTNPIRLPAESFEREVMLQDRSFDTNGQWFFPDMGANPAMHPFWIPEFFGDAIVVNGKTWPFMEVERRRYRFRFVNAANARFFQVQLSDGRPFYQIGTDGGFLDAPVRVQTLLLGVGERADVIVDFSSAPAGSTITMTNTAATPFPGGDPVDPNTTGQVMQFRVVGGAVHDNTCNPAISQSDPNACHLRDRPIVRLSRYDEHRQLVLREIASAIDEPLEVLLNNTRWRGVLEGPAGELTPVPIPDSVQVNDYRATELPQVGSTELWEVANLTDDAHPIHLHLIQFQVVSRRPFDSATYLAQEEATAPPGSGPPRPYNIRNADNAIGGNPAFTPFYQGPAVPAPANERGWKDTVIMPPGAVTRIIARWAPPDTPNGGVRPGQNLFPFDPTVGPGYVWHCHILDHEDNEMMRPKVVRRIRQALGDGGSLGGCMSDWRSTPCGATCTSQTQSDRAACSLYLDCFAGNSCGPSTCGGIDDICGVNTIGFGTAPRDIANQVYGCLCR